MVNTAQPCNRLDSCSADVSMHYTNFCVHMHTGAYVRMVLMFLTELKRHRCTDLEFGDSLFGLIHLTNKSMFIQYKDVEKVKL